MRYESESSESVQSENQVIKIPMDAPPWEQVKLLREKKFMFNRISTIMAESSAPGQLSFFRFASAPA